VNAGAGDLTAQRIGEARHAVLGRHVRREQRHGDPPAARPDIHDVSAALLQHVRQHKLGQPDDGPEIQAQQALDTLRVEVLQLTGLRNTRVVDEHIDPAKCVHRALDDLAQLFLIGNVRGKYQHVRRVRLDFAPDRFEPIFAPRHQDQPRAAPGK